MGYLFVNIFCHMLDEMYYILSSTVSYCYDLKKKLLISNIMNGKRYY